MASAEETESVTARVRAALGRLGIDLHRHPVRLAYADGVLTMEGELPDIAVICWWVPGTRDVVNALDVDPPEEDILRKEITWRAREPARNVRRLAQQENTGAVEAMNPGRTRMAKPPGNRSPGRRRATRPRRHRALQARRNADERGRGPEPPPARSARRPGSRPMRANRWIGATSPRTRA
jgi:hypothetical protein